MTPTIQSLDNDIKATQKQVNTLQDSLIKVIDKLTIYVTKAELASSISEIDQRISDFNTALTEVETKLQNILLPTDTRFFLQESEVTDFRNNFKILRAMMAELENTRKAFIKLASRYNLTNSPT